MALSWMPALRAVIDLVIGSLWGKPSGPVNLREVYSTGYRSTRLAYRFQLGARLRLFSRLAKEMVRQVDAPQRDSPSEGQNFSVDFGFTPSSRHCILARTFPMF